MKRKQPDWEQDAPERWVLRNAEFEIIAAVFRDPAADDAMCCWTYETPFDPIATREGYSRSGSPEGAMDTAVRLLKKERERLIPRMRAAK